MEQPRGGIMMRMSTSAFAGTIILGLAQAAQAGPAIGTPPLCSRR